MTNVNCRNYNQYYDDIINESGQIDPNKCFNGSLVYQNVDNYHFNDFLNYKSKDYYDFINKNFDRYSFPENYSELTYEQICEQQKYSLKPQQKFAGGIFNTHVQNNGLLIFHGLGSGKTQTSIVIGEAFKFKDINGSIIPGRTDSRILIVVPASLTDQYYSEIIGFIDNGVIKSASGEIVINGDRQYYLDVKIRRALNRIGTEIEKLEMILTNLPPDSPEYFKTESRLLQFKKDFVNLKEEESRRVTRVYEIMSHEKFLNKLYSNDEYQFEQMEYLQKLKVSNGLLIIDEAHRLVSATGTSYRKLLFALKYHSNKKFRTVLLTGSPIYDKPYEIGLLINLLKPRMQFPDGQEQFNEVFLTPDFKMKNIKLFKQMCNGYVSYFKGGNPEAYPYKKTIIMNHSMNPYQYSAYKNMLLKEIQKDKETSGITNNDDFMVKVVSSESRSDEVSISVFNNSRLFSNIVFPELTDYQKQDSRKSVAENGLLKFINVLSAVRRNNSERLSPAEINKLIISTVEEYSSKFARVAELIKKSEGPVFVYSNYVTYGVEAMASVLYSLGYSNFESKTTNPNSNNLKYFIWKGGKDQGVVSNARRVFNSMENKDGALIKVLFGTQSVMEGVDFKRVRQVHILDPWWNDSRIQQVVARAIRLCSHSGLPESSRITDVFIHLSTIPSSAALYSVTYNKLINGEKVEKKSYTTLVPVNPSAQSKDFFYNRNSIKLTPQGYDLITLKDEVIYADEILEIKKIKDPELSRKLGNWKNLDIDSVEEYMYFKSLKKISINRQFEYSMKQVSLDCVINKNGNIIRLDEKYIPTDKENIFKLEYENYTTGVVYSRIGVKSKFNTTLEESFLTLEDILDNTAKKSDSLQFKDSTGQILRLKKSLIVPEGIICENEEYSFSRIPRKIINLTINKELSKYLIQLDIKVLKKFVNDVESGKISVTDQSIVPKIKQFYSSASLSEKEKIIEKLKALNIAGEDTPWELESLEQLKIIYKSIVNTR